MRPVAVDGPAFRAHIRFSLGFGCALIASAISVAPSLACDIRDGGFNSRILPSGGPGRDWYVRTLTVLPKGFDPARRYGVVYFLHGRTGDRNILRDLDACGALDRSVDRGETPFVFVAIDGANHYWMNGAANGIRYGDVVTREWIADTESRLPVAPSPRARVLAGISMGGHGAIQLQLNNGGIYGAVAAHSPVFRTQEEASAEFRYEFGLADAYQWRDPFSLMMVKGRRLGVPLYLDMGGSDSFIRNTRNFSDYLRAAGTPDVETHVGADAAGGHAMGYWRAHFDEYVRWYAGRMKVE